MRIRKNLEEEKKAASNLKKQAESERAETERLRYTPNMTLGRIAGVV